MLYNEPLPETNFATRMKRWGIEKGSYWWKEELKKEFAEFVISELNSANPDQLALNFAIQQFLENWNAQDIQNEITEENEFFREFEYQSR